MRSKSLALVSCAVMLMSGAALAQQQPPTQSPTPPPSQPPAKTEQKPSAPTDAMKSVKFVPLQASGEMLTAELRGLEVKTPKGERIGDISDLVLDKNGKITTVVIGTGGFLGIGQRVVGVPYESLSMMTAEGGSMVAVLNTTKEALESAPAYVTLKAKKAEDDRAIQRQKQQQQAPTQRKP